MIVNLVVVQIIQVLPMENGTMAVQIVVFLTLDVAMITLLKLQDRIEKVVRAL